MKVIPIKKSVFTLLILEAVILALITIILIFSLYRSYTHLIYTESSEVLCLYTIIAQSRLSRIEDLSYEILSNHSIQENMKTYTLSDSSYEKNLAKKTLYTQLFTRWVMDKNILSITFIFFDGDKVETSSRRNLDVTSEKIDNLIVLANQLDGSLQWKANIFGDNTLTLFRTINDISGDGFKPLGTLIINIDANYFLEHSFIHQKYMPSIFCVADGEILSESPFDIEPFEILGFMDSANPYDIVSVDREQYFISAKELNYTHWFLVYILPVKDILYNIRTINLIYILILSIVVTLVLFVGYQITDGITKPIIRLTKAIKVVENGDYTVALKEPDLDGKYGISEVVQLTKDFSDMVHKIDHLINEGYVKQLMIMEMRYKVLQQQINPHFLYNTLDTINWKAIEGSQTEISTMVRSLSKMLRGSVKDPDIITIRDAISFVEEYLTIQKMRFEERLEYHADILPETLNCKIPRLTLQPIVENCIIHNLEKYAAVCRISISSSLTNESIEICVEDNGRGADLLYVEKVLNGEAEAGNTSIGIRNIHERIRISFGEQYGLKVENVVPSGTKVIVHLPVS
ncbi:MAG: sensor histidine kinase [Clostridiaceae bacterium]|nr:sensor histidine kinase [Clostridiaceae bacterium]